MVCRLCRDFVWRTSASYDPSALYACLARFVYEKMNEKPLLHEMFKAIRAAEVGQWPREFRHGRGEESVSAGMGDESRDM